MRKFIKKISLAIMSIAFLSMSVFSVNVFAEDNSSSESEDGFVIGVYNYSQVSPESSDTYYIGECDIGGNRYEVNRYYGDWYAILALDLSYPYYKGTTAMTVAQTMSKSYNSQAAYQFSTAMGGTANAEIFSMTSTITNTVSYTTGVRFDISSNVTYQIGRDDDTGYYKIGVCHDIYRHRVDKYSGSSLVAQYDMPTPKGIAYFALLYSNVSDSGYHKY